MMDRSGLQRAGDGWGGWRGSSADVVLGFLRRHWLTNIRSVPLGGY